jgi:hypothetical protein
MQRFNVPGSSESLQVLLSRHTIISHTDPHNHNIDLSISKLTKFLFQVLVNLISIPRVDALERLVRKLLPTYATFSLFPWSSFNSMVGMAPPTYSSLNPGNFPESFSTNCLISGKRPIFHEHTFNKAEVNLVYCMLLQLNSDIVVPSLVLLLQHNIASIHLRALPKSQ